MIGDHRAPEAPPCDALAKSITEARELLARLPSPDLGKLASTILPALEVGEAGRWSLILLALIRHELAERELSK